jgi:hypothetical protein
MEFFQQNRPIAVRRDRLIFGLFAAADCVIGDT